MGRAYPSKSSALIVGQDAAQRELVGVLLEECELKVIECDSAEAALSVLNAVGKDVLFLFTDLNLAGMRDGVDLAKEVRRRWPKVRIVTTSGGMTAERLRALPRDVAHLQKPWRPLDILVEAGKATDQLRH
jgi:CheY-like chemotaxis protein